jgi:hypothetical protein
VSPHGPTSDLFTPLQELHGRVAADLPVEALLQRPAVLTNILSLLHAADKDSLLPLAAVSLLQTIAQQAKRALLLAQDPRFAIPDLPGWAAAPQWGPPRTKPCGLQKGIVPGFQGRLL